MPKAFLLTNKRYKIWKQIKETFLEEQRRRKLVEQELQREQEQMKVKHHSLHHHHQVHQQQHEYHNHHHHQAHFTDSDRTRDRMQPAHVISSTDYSKYTDNTDEGKTYCEKRN